MDESVDSKAPAPSLGEPNSTEDAPKTALDAAIIRIDLEKDSNFQNLDKLQQGSAKRAMISLQVAINMGYLNVGRVKRILDFGAGRGGPTFALARVAEVIGADVEAIEISDGGATNIVTSGILPADKVHIGDGVKFLSKIRPGKEYDLITGFMFGPDDTFASLFLRVAGASSKALSPHGHLLINSDMGTVAGIERVAKVHQIEYDCIQGVGRELPTTLIIPKMEVAKLAY